MRPIISALVILVAIAELSEAQDVKRSTLVARIADARTGAPLEGAEVILPQLRRVARSNSAGQVRLTGIAAGSHRVRVRHLGYAAADVELRFDADSVESLFMLDPATYELDTIQVVREPVPAYLQAFETRRRMGFGRFLSARDLIVEQNRDFVNVAITRFPGLRQFVDGDRRPRLASSRGSCGVARQTVSLRGSQSSGGRFGSGGVNDGAGGAGGSCFSGRPCVLQVFLDDMNMGDDFDLVRTWDLAGVEYYTGASMPPQYRVEGSACGVLLLWSKR